MTDPFASAFDRLDDLHREFPLPRTCTDCAAAGHQRATTSADRLCGLHSQERRTRLLREALG